jgi:hypothetical protein
MRRGRRLHRHCEPRCRVGRIRRESAPPEFRDRERRASYRELAATSTLCLIPSVSVKETRQVRAVGRRDVVSPRRRKGEYELNSCGHLCPRKN